MLKNGIKSKWNFRNKWGLIEINRRDINREIKGRKSLFKL
jgi:hypothetical protein